MRGVFSGLAMWLMAVLGLAISAVAAPASAQINPRSFVIQVADQWRTGKSQPVLYGDSVRRVVAEQTNNSGIYPSLARLGPVRNVTLESTQPLARGTTWMLVATHEHGVSNWQVGYSERTGRVEYVEFTIGRRSPSGASNTTTSGAVTGPVILGPTSPSAPSSSSSQPPVTVPPPRPTGGSEASTACQKFPNLC